MHGARRNIPADEQRTRHCCSASGGGLPASMHSICCTAPAERSCGTCAACCTFDRVRRPLAEQQAASVAAHIERGSSNYGRQCTRRRCLRQRCRRRRKSALQRRRKSRRRTRRPPQNPSRNSYYRYEVSMSTSWNSYRYNVPWYQEVQTVLTSTPAMVATVSIESLRVPCMYHGTPMGVP